MSAALACRPQVKEGTLLVSVTDVDSATRAAIDAAPEGRTDPSGAHTVTAIHPGQRHGLHLGHPALRTADGHHRDERRASWLELFFDLAFAGAVGQLAGAFQTHPGLAALAGFAILFTPIWWLWVQLTFYADRHETKDASHRISILAAILLCIALAASAPRALDGQSAGFIIAFACLRGLQLLLYARAWRHLPATRPLYSCYLIWFGIGGALWLASLAVEGSARYAFWGVALIADAVGSLAMLTRRRRLPLNTAHLADRFQIFVLIVLGESMARLISAAAARPWSLPLAVVLTAALVTLAALWWSWLTAADRSALDTPAAIARFTALNLPLVAGIAAASAGLHIAILAADGASTIGVGPRAALYGGVSVCLLASILLPSRNMSAPARVVRLGTALAAMGLVFMGAIVEPVYLVPALTAVLALGLTVEARHRASPDDPEIVGLASKEHPCRGLDTSGDRGRGRTDAGRPIGMRNPNETDPPQEP
jgi:low temperature requirement protein LtrA